MYLLKHPISYRQTTLNFQRTEINLERPKHPLRSQRIREFGKEITNLNLTVIQDGRKNPINIFFFRVGALKQNQYKKKKKPHYRQTKTFKNQIKKANKRNQFNLKIQEFLNLIPINSIKNHSSFIQNKFTIKNTTIQNANGYESLAHNNIIGNCNITEYNTSENNIQNINDYQTEIFSYLIENEGKYQCHPDYMKNQYDINDKMRAILVDWLVSVHLKYSLSRETLFLTINILDRYLDKVQLERNELQLVGIASLFIASKYEEVYPPEIKEMAYITNNSFTIEQILQMETLILLELQFEITIISPLSILDFIFIKEEFNALEKNQVYYLLELSLVNGKMKNHSPLTLALAVSMMVKKEKSEGIIEMFEDFDKRKNTVELCLNDLREIYEEDQRKINDLKAVYNKYSQDNFGNCSNYSI